MAKARYLQTSKVGMLQIVEDHLISRALSEGKASQEVFLPVGEHQAGMKEYLRQYPHNQMPGLAGHVEDRDFSVLTLADLVGNDELSVAASHLTLSLRMVLPKDRGVHYGTSREGEVYQHGERFIFVPTEVKDGRVVRPPLGKKVVHNKMVFDADLGEDVAVSVSDMRLVGAIATIHAYRSPQRSGQALQSA